MVLWAAPKFSFTVLISGIGSMLVFVVTALVQGHVFQILMSAPSYILMIPLFLVSLMVMRSRRPLWPAHARRDPLPSADSYPYI